jgi:hypothetical protein
VNIISGSYNVPLRMALGAFSVALAAYFFWCTLTDTPSSPVAKVLLPIMLMATAAVRLSRKRTGS